MVQMVRHGVVLQELPSAGHGFAFQNIQPYFSQKPNWFRRLFGWEMCEVCKGHGQITILSEEALKIDGEQIFEWTTWTSFLPPIELEARKPCPVCDGLGRIKRNITT